VYQAIEETVTRMIPRIKAWIHLRQKRNADKRMAIFYYNHSQGKQNISASYLNMFRSLQAVLDCLRLAGYATGDGKKLTEADVKAAVMKSGRNIGSWAPGELAHLIAEGGGVRLSQETYSQWFETLPESFRQAVADQWGPPETATVMADAMVHLGTYATHEWLPGKQAGLAPWDAPEVLVTDLPNIYPYIVDNIGEGLQAKRRGRGVVVDHLIPRCRMPAFTTNTPNCWR
jgi:cobaltochelatase CobN